MRALRRFDCAKNVCKHCLTLATPVRKLCSTGAGRFALDERFVASYSSKKPNFGFNGLGELVYFRSYSRTKQDGSKERWHDTVERVVNGTFRLQQGWANTNALTWDAEEAQDLAQEMFTRIFEMKFLPPGRGLWAMGTAITEERELFAALNNCAFVSTADICDDPAQPFCFLMDAAMLGVGVGFDTLGVGQITVRPVDELCSNPAHQVEDSREGWVKSVRLLIQAYLGGPIAGGAATEAATHFDYSQIRPAGVPIKGFGGTSSGPQSLLELHEALHSVFTPLAGQPLTVTAIVDTMNLIGKCVISGNVRRTAEIAFGDPNSTEYMDLKDYTVNPHRAAHGWTSNNSVFATVGMDYGSVARKVQVNGEPGLAWLENMQRWGRMQGAPDDKDWRAGGGNPCLEQTLESYELCCLVETFPAAHADLDDYRKTLELAFLYAKTVTLSSAKIHWPQSREVMERNRRIGTSMSGIAQFTARHGGLQALQEWCEGGYALLQEYDERLSAKWKVPKSIKTTCIKPSGTVSLVAGATPGLHYPEAEYYIRRVRLPTNSELVQPLHDAGYALEPAVEDANTVVVSVPVHVHSGVGVGEAGSSGKAGSNARVRTLTDMPSSGGGSAGVTLWEQLALAATLQRHWADNQVSCTVTFDPASEGDQIEDALVFFQHHLKGVSFLPRLEAGAYEQMPYEQIDRATYVSMTELLSPIDFSTAYAQQVDPGAPVEVPDKFCESASCEIEGGKIR
jgi:adenosylcobalamin-dependent ribonucleoside-triphosphate reductase